MPAHYIPHLNKIVAEMSISDLSRSDQIRVASDLLKASGIMDAMLESGFCKEFCEVWRKAADAYCAGGNG